MDKLALDLIIKAIDDCKEDTHKRCDRLEEILTDKFKDMNVRVRKSENDILRIKTLWSAGMVVAGILFHYFFG